MKPTAHRGPIAWFASNPVAANLLMMLILLTGVITAAGLRTEGFPNMEPSAITISVAYDSGSAKQAEEGIAIKIEESLQGLDSVKKIISTADGSGATVTVIKESEANLEQLLSDVKTRVDGIYGFPVRAEKPVITKEQWSDHAIWVTLYGDADQDVFQQISRRLRDDLLLQTDISSVSSSGSLTPEVSIEIDEGKLQYYGLTLDAVAEAIAKESLTATNGMLRGENGSLTIKADNQAYRYQDFAQIVIRSGSDGSRVLLTDLATVQDGFENDTLLSTRFQGKTAVSLQIVMDNKADVARVVDQANAVVNNWNESGRIPQNLQLTTWYDQSGFIASRIKLMLNNALTGIVLVILVLALFLNLRVALWVAAGLPICFAGALLLMGEGLLSLSLNDLTTFGFIIALGIVVDDAVVVGESIYDTRKTQGDSLDSTIAGVKKVAVPTIFGVLTTVAAFYPLSLIEGDMGKIFAQFSIVVVVCLLFSMLESKLILPAHLAHIKTQPTQLDKTEGANQKKSVARFIREKWYALQHLANLGLTSFNNNMYQPALAWALERRYSVVCLFIAVLVIVVGLVPSGKVRSVFFPDIPGDVISVDIQLQEQAGYHLTLEHALTLEDSAREINHAFVSEFNLDNPVIKNVHTEITSDYSATVTAELSPREERPVSTALVSERWQQRVSNLEAMDKLEFISSWAGAEDLRIELLSADNQQLKQAAASLKQALRGIAGVDEIDDNLNPGQPRLDLTLTEQGRAFGLTLADLAEQLQQAYFGFEVQRFQRGKDEVKVQVRLPQSDRTDAVDLMNSRIRTASGQVVPLNLVARMESGYVVSSINRLNGQRAAVITGDVDKTQTSPSAVLEQLQEHVFPVLKRDFPDLTITLGGEAQYDAQTSASVGKMFGLSLIMIYILLAVPLKSYGQPLLIMAVIPFGIVGAILGHWWNDLPMSLLSMFGILALCGVVVNDSLILVTRYNVLREQKLSVNAALTGAASSRLRAIFLTSLTTFVGLYPLLQETSAQAQVLIPTAVSLAYGIVFATVNTLILIPLLLRIREDFRNNKTLVDDFSQTVPEWQLIVPDGEVQQEKQTALL